MMDIMSAAEIIAVLKDPPVLFAIASILATVLVLIFGNFKPKMKALDPDNYIAFSLVEKVVLSHDTRMFRFALQSPKHVLGLPIGQHVSMKYVGKDGKMVTRSYTPTSSDHDAGHVDFVIKVYFPNVDPRFPEGGKMSMHLENLKLGDTLEMRGPKGNLTYLGTGNFKIRHRDDRKIHKLGMIAGGTGITPMLQIITAVLREGSKMEMSLIFANKTVEDILLRDMIEKLVSQHPNFKVHYTLDRAPNGWEYSEGFITQEMVGKYMPAPGPKTLVLMCGPPGMLKFACLPALNALGYPEDMHYSF